MKEIWITPFLAALVYSLGALKINPFFECFNLSLTPKIKIPILRKSCELKQERT